jgi:hypothetical protein
MKICWDNLEKVKYNKKTGAFSINGRVQYYHETCMACKEPYIGQKKVKFCCPSCSSRGENNPMYGKKHKTTTIEKIRFKSSNISESTRSKMRESGKVKTFSESHRKNLSKSCAGEKNGFYGKNHKRETKAKRY